MVGRVDVTKFLIYLSVTVAVGRYALRMCWDFMTYHFFIKKSGRVPATDSFAVRRIEGPGLNSNYFYVIRPEQALAAFEAKMESDELQAFQKATELSIKQPQKDFTKFVDACFGSFSAQLSSTGAYRDLERESKELLNLLAEKLEKRRNELQIELPMSSKGGIKMNALDLKIAIQQSAHLLERFYPDHVIARSQMSMDEFWDSKVFNERGRELAIPESRSLLIYKIFVVESFQWRLGRSGRGDVCGNIQHRLPYSDRR